ncbi:MAG: hypothetical protein R3B82_17090 [Sandaracinaceae bacterium]
MRVDSDQVQPSSRQTTTDQVGGHRVGERDRVTSVLSVGVHLDHRREAGGSWRWRSTAARPITDAIPART